MNLNYTLKNIYSSHSHLLPHRNQALPRQSPKRRLDLRPERSKVIYDSDAIMKFFPAMTRKTVYYLLYVTVR